MEEPGFAGAHKAKLREWRRVAATLGLPTTGDIDSISNERCALFALEHEYSHPKRLPCGETSYPTDGIVP